MRRAILTGVGTGEHTKESRTGLRKTREDRDADTWRFQLQIRVDDSFELLKLCSKALSPGKVISTTWIFGKATFLCRWITLACSTRACKSRSFLLISARHIGYIKRESSMLSVGNVQYSLDLPHLAHWNQLSWVYEVPNQTNIARCAGGNL